MLRDFTSFFFFLSISSLPLSQNLSFQPPEMVIDQVKFFQKIPIYTISFNYNDKMANDFLKELASLTGGEFHSYQLGSKDACLLEAEQVRAWWAGKSVHLTARDSPEAQEPHLDWENSNHKANEVARMDPLTVSTPVSVRDPWTRVQVSMQIPESPFVTTESGSRHRTPRPCYILFSAQVFIVESFKLNKSRRVLIPPWPHQSN